MSVGIKGPQTIIENLSDSRITATIDLQNISNSGEFKVSVNIETPKNVEIIKIIPEEFHVLIERIIKKIIN